jgi:predicted ester cyclase
MFLTLLIMICGCNSNNQASNLETNRELVRKYSKIWSTGNVETLDKIMAPDFVCHFIDGIEWKGIDGAKNAISNIRNAFPDWHEEILDVIAEGDKVVVRFKSTGTQRARFDGIDSTGIKITIYEVSINRIINGKLVEQWGFPDALSFNHQLQPKK